MKTLPRQAEMLRELKTELNARKRIWANATDDTGKTFFINTDYQRRFTLLERIKEMIEDMQPHDFARIEERRRLETTQAELFS